MNKKVLMIGGAGFIGSRFCHLTDHETTVIDTKLNSTVYDASGTYDTVMFLAAEPNLRSVKENPTNAYKTMTEHLHEAIIRFADSHFIFISSSMVYGDWTADSMSESDVPAPKDMYGRLKLLGESITKTFHQNYTIVRPSAVYGPNDNPKRVVNLFINQIKKGECLKIQGTTNKFDFTYVDDVIQGLDKIVTHRPKNEIYNLTRGEAHTLHDLKDLLYRKLDKAPYFQMLPNPEDYPMRGALNISKIKHDLNYMPQYDLSTGLDDTISKLT